MEAAFFVRTDMSKNLFVLFSTLVLTSLFIGCGSKYDLVPVSGTVTLDGKPLADVTIFTQPTDPENPEPGPGSVARTDADGNFELELQAGKEQVMGAIAGTVRITIIENGEAKASNDDSGQAFRRKVPVEYRDGMVKYDIPAEGTDAMNIEIETKKRR